ncbi:unnamed protein product, partial [Didymodactylos carnosus]
MKSSLCGLTFVLDISSELRYKEKNQLINYIRNHGGNVSYALTASTDYVLVKSNVASYKTRRAKHLGIPLISLDYIYECQKNSDKIIDPNRYLITSAEDKESFKNGKIPVDDHATRSINVSKSKIDISKVKVWNYDDINLPQFDESNSEVAKWAIFKETNVNSSVYFVLEIQVIPDRYYEPLTSDYRLRFRYEKQSASADQGRDPGNSNQTTSTLVQYMFTDDVSEQQQLFSTYFNRISTMPRITRIKDVLPSNIGSKALLRLLWNHKMDTQSIDDNICQLIESIWLDSMGDLQEILSVTPESISLKNIIEAESLLLEQKRLLDDNQTLSSDISGRFYILIPHNSLFQMNLNDRKILREKMDLCQVLRDMLTVNEITCWNMKPSTEAKYRSLKCYINTVNINSFEYRKISELIHSSTDSYVSNNKGGFHLRS